MFPSFSLKEDAPDVISDVTEYRSKCTNSNDPIIQFKFAENLMKRAAEIDANITLDVADKITMNAYVVEGIQWLKKAADGGYLEAMFYLGQCYELGSFGMKKDVMKAFLLFKQAAKLNYSPAAWKVGCCLEEGIGIGKDVGKALHYYRKAAFSGNANASYKLSQSYENGSLTLQVNHKESLIWLKRTVATPGVQIPEALHRLANFYVGDDKSFTNDKNTSGNFYVSDDDRILAGQYFMQAAQLGHLPSQKKIAECYEKGICGYKRDPKRALVWYERVAENDSQTALYVATLLFNWAKDGVIEGHGELAFKMAKKAAEYEMPAAQFALGYFYEVGFGVDVNLGMAIYWFNRSAEHGYKQARDRLLDKFGRRVYKRERKETKSTDCIIS